MGPKPYARARDGVGEASEGVRIGQPLSRETFGLDPARRVVFDPGTRGCCLFGSRVISGLAASPCGGRPAAGRRAAVAADERV